MLDVGFTDRHDARVAWSLAAGAVAPALPALAVWAHVRQRVWLLRAAAAFAIFGALALWVWFAS